MGRRKQQTIICGSKSSRKRSADKGSPDQNLKGQESPESDVSSIQPSNVEQELSRSGKPIGWKVLPREAPQQLPVDEKVMHSELGHFLTAQIMMHAHQAMPVVGSSLASSKVGL